MSEQLVFPGFERPQTSKPADNLFLALVPPVARLPFIAERTQQFRKDHGLRGKPLAPSCFHVSLYGLGRYDGLPHALLDDVNTAVSMLATPAFDIAFDRAMSFSNKKANRPFVLRAGGDVIALNAFHRILGEAMTRAGLGRRVSRHFTPHMTLLYDRRLVDEHMIETFGWPVTEFVLVHSLVGQGKHVHLARWPLHG